MPRKQESHILKCWPEYFKEVWDKNKNFEIRKDDRDIQENDEIILREWNKDTERFTGRIVRCYAGYIIRDPKFVKKGFCTIALKYMTNTAKYGLW